MTKFNHSLCQLCVHLVLSLQQLCVPALIFGEPCNVRAGPAYEPVCFWDSIPEEAGAEPEIRFLDFDWSGESGVARLPRLHRPPFGAMAGWRARLRARIPAA